MSLVHPVPARGKSRLRVGLAWLLALGLSIPAAGCAPPPIHETLWVFGTRAHIELRGVDRVQGEAALAEAGHRLTLLHREWHAWEDSDLVRINAALARGESATATASIVHALNRAAPLVSDSDGLFDPTIGGLVALWGFHRSEFPILDPPPDASEVAAWLSERPRMSDVSIDGNRLSSRNPRAQLDLAAVAEGLAVAQVAKILADHDIRHALIGLGGDVLALGQAGDRPWRIAVRDPLGAAPDAALGWLNLHDGESLFSSGGYQRYGESPDGARWPHILDPRTGVPATRSAGVAVLHADPVTADAAATALFIAGPDGFAELTASMGLGCALLLDHEDRLYLTEAMAKRLRLMRTPTQTERVDRGPSCQQARD